MGVRSSENVTVILRGQPWDGWKKVVVQQDFDKASGNGTLTITETPSDPFPAALGDPVIVICGSTPVLTGMVYAFDSPHDHKEHEIHITLRDKTQNLNDSTLGPGHKYQPPISHPELARKVVSRMGLDFAVIDKVGAEPYGPGEVPNGDIEEYGQRFLDSWGQKRQLLHNTDGKGNLVIDRNQLRRGPGMLWKGFQDDPRNNVLRAHYKNTLQDRHNQTAASAQKSPDDKKHWESRPKGDPPAQSGPLSKHWGVEHDSAIPPQRRKHFRAARGADGGSPKKAAKWRSNVAKARGFQYVAKVQGFEAAPGVIWWHGYVIPVFDVHYRISDELFISGVKFEKDWKGGAWTEVICTYKDAFSDQSATGAGNRTAQPGIGTPSAGSHGAAPTSGME